VGRNAVDGVEIAAPAIILPTSILLFAKAAKFPDYGA
jgi:hypothetical protein